MPKGLEYLAVEFKNIDPLTDLIVTVESTIWIESDMEIEFLGHKMFLIPESDKSDPIIRFPLTDIFFSFDFQRESPKIYEAFSIVLRLLSAFTWNYQEPFTCNGLMTILKGMNVSTKSNRIHVKDYFNPKEIVIGNDADSRLALALFREALTSDNIPMKFLSFAKILNVKYKDKQQEDEFNRIVRLLSDKKALNRINQLDELGEDVGEKLYKSGRCAIAHANTAPTIDPDDTSDLYELHLDMPLVKSVAEYIINVELNLQSILLR